MTRIDIFYLRATRKLVLFSLIAMATTATAQDTTWNRSPGDGPGDWNDAANWSLNAVPTLTNTARLSNGGTARVTAPSLADRLLFATGANSSAFLEIVPGGSLDLDGNTNQFGAGENATTVITMTGGALNYTGTGATDLARFGSATLDVSDGVFSVGGTMRVGVFERDGQGTILLSGGSIEVGANLSLNHGASNAGTFNRDPFGEAYHTGGELDVVGTTYIGFSSAPRGHALYELGAATFRTGALSIGGGDVATFRITDAAADITIGSSMAIANNAHIEAAAGTTIEFSEPTGMLIGDAMSPFFAENVYFQNEMDIADSANVSGLGDTTLVFAGGPLGGANVGLFEVAGTDLGATPAGFENNFTLGGLSIGDGVNVGNLKLADLLLNGAADATPQALYVKSLNLSAGSTLDLNGLNLYYQGGSIEGLVTGGSITLVPEPTGLLLGLCGGVLLATWLAHHRGTRRTAIAVEARGEQGSGANFN